MLIKIIQQHVNGQWWVVNRRSLLLTIHNSQFTKSQIAIGALNGASQQKLNQGSKACIIKNSLKYLLIHFLICNFSLPCTPFENLS